MSFFSTKSLFQQSRNTVSVACLSLVITACGGGSSGGSDPIVVEDEDIIGSEVLTDIGDVVNDDFVQLDSRVASFDSELDSFCDDVTDAEQKAATQASFKELMGDVQKTLLYQFGPAVTNSRITQVYSWPLTDTCLIDLQLAQNTDLSAQLSVSRRGVDALEYLLFPQADMPFSCQASDVSTANLALLNTFSELSEADQQARRCSLMKSITADVAENTGFIKTDWADYKQTLTEATEITVFANLITDAMFYFEETLKEFKVGQPLGGLPENTETIPSCGAGVVCPEDRESKHASLAKENLIANMRGFQTLFHGGNVEDKETRIGFDDWLNDVGQSELAAEMSEQIELVIAALDALEGSLGDNLVNNPSAVQSILDVEITLLSRNLKEIFIPTLGLALPSGSGSDTD